MSHPCECPEKGFLLSFMEGWYDHDELPYVTHERGQCKNPVTKPYRRNGKVIWLCSCCNMGADVLVSEDEVSA